MSVIDGEPVERLVADFRMTAESEEDGPRFIRSSHHFESLAERPFVIGILRLVAAGLLVIGQGKLGLAGKTVEFAEQP